VYSPQTHNSKLKKNESPLELLSFQNETMVSLSIPNSEKTAQFNKAQLSLPFTYEPLFCTRTNTHPAGFDADIQKVVIGKGAADFERAMTAILTWQMFPKPWTTIQPQTAPIVEGEQVTMYAQFFGIWWRNACRIVYLVDTPTSFGFAYGTTPGHLERGEELFLVEIDENDDVWYTIQAYSQPRHVFAKIGYPLMRMLQARFRRDSARVMEQIARNEQA
jgi:uncharacterized protein (UPF0548 family)